jgi:hypothetical protein
MKRRAAVACTLAVILGVLPAGALADIEVTSLYFARGVPNRIRTELKGSALEAIIDGVQLVTNIVGIIRGLASGDPFGVITGAMGAYREALQLSNSAGDKTAWGEMRVTLYTTETSSIQFRVKSDDDPIGHLRVGAPRIRGIRVRGAPRSDTSDSGLGRDLTATVTLDGTQLRPGRYPFVFSTKETNCSQCLSVIHLVTVEVKRPVTAQPCPRQPACSRQRARYDEALRDYEVAGARLRSNAARASARYMRELTRRLEICRRTGERSGNCDSDPDPGPCPGLALGATAAQCRQLADLKRNVEEKRRLADAEWARGVSMGCCLFGVPGGRPSRPVDPRSRDHRAPRSN